MTMVFNVLHMYSDACHKKNTPTGFRNRQKGQQRKIFKSQLLRGTLKLDMANLFQLLI